MFAICMESNFYLQHFQMTFGVTPFERELSTLQLCEELILVARHV